MNELKFKISSALKNIIGKDLITDDFIAVFELVKNSYDAYADSVDIIFEEDTIIISDNGKGMSYKDLIDKWLFVAYSAKSHGVEDKDVQESNLFEDYRTKIKPKKYYAGAKGVGRFSCDRLGEELKLITKSAAKSSNTHIITVNWKDFENNVFDEFADVNVTYEEVLDDSHFQKNEHGTVLIIKKLRSNWDRRKLLNLKHSLEKLINPFEKNDNSSFSISISAEDQINKDKEEENPRNRINGEVGNFLFEKLEVKTTQIITEIKNDSEFVETKLIDRGIELFNIRERNPYIFKDNKKLSNVKIHLFYLNRAAKYNFTKIMGIRPISFGSVFLYRNGFRVYPYGEPDRDIFNIDSRKSQKTFDRLGTRDLLGRIEIIDDHDNFKESTSRDGGLIRNNQYQALKDLFERHTLYRLENYVVNIQWALEDKGEDLIKISSFEGKEKIVELIAALTENDEIELISYNQNFLDIVSDKLNSEKDTIIFENLKQIAGKLNDEKYLKYIDKVENKYLQEKERRRHVERVLDDTESEKLFLKSLRSSQDEVLSFVHHIGISANTVDNYLKGVTKRMNKGKEFSKDDFSKILQAISFENRKIMSIARFATKANFKLYTELRTSDLVNYIEEYIFNVIENVESQKFNMKVIETKPFEFEIEFRPIEFNIIIDNFISNSKKAGADSLIIRLTEIDENQIEIKFTDNGEGISPKNIDKIFNFGFTTTTGSGIGLFHVQTIIKEYGGTISVESIPGKTEFTIILKA